MSKISLFILLVQNFRMKFFEKYQQIYNTHMKNTSRTTQGKYKPEDDDFKDAEYLAGEDLKHI